MKTKFDPRQYQGKRRIYPKVSGGVRRLYVWNETLSEYRAPEVGKCYLARRWETVGGERTRVTRYFDYIQEARQWLESQETENLAIPRRLAFLGEQVREFPLQACESAVYFLVKSNDVVYVGQTVTLVNRIQQHQKSGKDFDQVFFVPAAKADLDEREGALIKALRPQLNRRSGARPKPCKTLNSNGELT